jgi:hypothetical protein
MRSIYFLLLATVLVSSCGRSVQNPVRAGAEPAGQSIQKAAVSFRVGTTQWMPEARFNELLKLFDKYKGVTDEITFFTQTTHAPLPADEIRRRTIILKERLSEARKHGYSSGINILTTIGHHNENLDNSLKGPYTNMTNIDGETCKGSFCPNDTNLQTYVRSVYTYASEAHPDYIWIDDDVRFGHMPIGYGCFCANCLRIFNDEYGHAYSREELRRVFNESDIKVKLRVREEWLQHNRNTISNLFRLIERTVHTADPKIKLGFMTGDRFFEGYDFDNWARILSGPDSTEVMWRPGGGFYTDINTNDLSGKSHDIGRQVSQLPARVRSIESEIECFPYQRLKKAANIIVLEACSHIASGCTGAAFNVLSMYDEPLDEFEPLIEELQAKRPFFDLLASRLGRTPGTGIAALWNKNSYATGNITEGNWLRAGNPVVSHEIFNIGIPVSYSSAKSVVTLLGKNNILALSDGEIRKLLSGGVYMDAEALDQLNSMGYGKFTGFEVTSSELHDRIERLSGDPLNGRFAGRERDNRQSFWNEPAYSLKKTDDKARILSSLVDYTDSEVAGCTSGIFENSLGGRVFVGGYYPWSFTENLSKSSQLKSVFRWLSKDVLPGYIDSFHRINIWFRNPGVDNIALALTNSSFDEARNVVLFLKTGKNEICIYDMNCKRVNIRSSGSDGPYRKFVIPSIDPWQMRLITSE